MREARGRMRRPTPPRWDTTPSETSLMSLPTQPSGNSSGTPKPFPK
jgi:hypothetical protein